MMEMMRTMEIQQDTLPLILFNSTSGPSGDQHKMTTMNREGEKAPEAAETFFIDGDSLEKSRITMVNLQLEGKFSEHGKKN